MKSFSVRSLRNPLLGGIALYLFGFIVGDNLLSLLFTKHGQIPFSELSGGSEVLFFSTNILIKTALPILYSRQASHNQSFQMK